MLLDFDALRGGDRQRFTQPLLGEKKKCFPPPEQDLFFSASGKAQPFILGYVLSECAHHDQSAGEAHLTLVDVVAESLLEHISMSVGRRQETFLDENVMCGSRLWNVIQS